MMGLNEGNLRYTLNLEKLEKAGLVVRRINGYYNHGQRPKDAPLFSLKGDTSESFDAARYEVKLHPALNDTESIQKLDARYHDYVEKVTWDGRIPGSPHRHMGRYVDGSGVAAEFAILDICNDTAMYGLYIQAPCAARIVNIWHGIRNGSLLPVEGMDWSVYQACGFS